MEILESIPEAIFELLGVIIGLFVCFITVLQIIKEYKSKSKSSLSVSYVLGWVFVYFFWSIYGLRFQAMALMITNAIALCIQIVLCVVVQQKNQQK